MNATTARRVRHIRALTLTAAFVLFVALLLLLRRPGVPMWLSRGVFFAIDPLLLVQHLAATHTVLASSIAALVPLALTLILGRFFCGWVCPFGALQEFVSWVSGTHQEPKAAPDRCRLGIKYLVLIVVIVSALAGTALGGWLDPFALLTRSIAASLEPALGGAVVAARPGARVSAQPVLIGSIFLLIIGLSAWKRRFFCATMCPLGALYGLVARFSLIRCESATGCKHCSACASRCTFGGGAGENYIKSECDLCMACARDCRRDNVRIEFGSLTTRSGAALDLGRRKVLGTAAAGLAVAVLPKAAIGAPARAQDGRGFLRPPGSVREELFLSRCVRCGQCVESCPTNFIQLARLEAGFEGLWTPVLNARAGYCVYDCVLCTRACPTGAIEPLPLTHKQARKVGTAVIDTSRCLTYTEGATCTVCVERCPIPGKPLRFRRAATQGLSVNQIGVQQLYVVPDLCTGCGICEHFCPLHGAPGITIVPEDEDREAVNSVIA